MAYHEEEGKENGHGAEGGAVLGRICPIAMVFLPSFSLAFHPAEMSL